jgi:class 3 adenylate cyclase
MVCNDREEAGLSPERAIESRSSSIERLSRIIDVSDIDLRGQTSPDGAMTIMFSDIEDSTQLVERLGDEDWLGVLRVHNRLVRESVRRHGGSEVKSQGDGFMLAFTSSRAALLCAVDIQRTLAANGAASEHRVRVRIGLHSGFMIYEEDDYIGRNVILAARIADQAGGDEILVSSDLKEFVESSPPARFLDPRPLELKGLSGVHWAYPVEWRAG